MVANKINITIIHPFEIVLTGLSEIIANCCENKILKAKSIVDLPDYPNIMGGHLIIVPEFYYSKNRLLFERVYSNALTIKYLHLEEPSSKNNLQSISIDDSTASICLKINDILKSFQIHKQGEDQYELSDRETDVLKLIAEGLKNKDIAAKLFISTHTVVTHRKNITAKLNIKSVSGLTVYAVLKKIINIDKLNPTELI
ncbi:MAG: helix-turn-helix transcriptional regulator [Bacteroidales bacterium]|jgi:DNA-binding CsgD family transcriptional regulator|nr:helix-turn-helix transcriptional regulator [Bacteroidales bacterium]